MIKVKNDHRSKFLIYAIGMRKPEKIRASTGFEPATSLPMCGFIAQLVEHRTGMAEVAGSNPVEALIF